MLIYPFLLRLNGKSYDLEWIKEGHRKYPLISRAPAYSALHFLADHASKMAAFENTELLHPTDTKREIIHDNEVMKHIITEDPTKPPTISTSTMFSMNRKDLKRSLDLVTLHPHAKKKHYHHLKPAPPNVKIQHLYQTLNASSSSSSASSKRPRKTFAKKPKTKASKQSRGCMQLSFPTSSAAAAAAILSQSTSSSSPSDERHFDGAELQKHLTSQMMPPPSHYQKKYMTQQHQLPTNKKEMNLLKTNHQQSLEPQAHYIPNNRLKNELMCEPSNVRGGSLKSTKSQKNANASHSYRNNYNSKLYSNGASCSSSSLSRSQSLDYIPDPQIIFNTSSKADNSTPSQLHEQHHHNSFIHENNEHDLSPSMASPLQLLSTAASCTPKLKVSSASNNSNQQQQQQQQQHLSQLPSATFKNVQNRSIKIIPTNNANKSVVIKPQENSNLLKQQQQQQQQHATIFTSTNATTSPKFKIQKIQLVMNKSQDNQTKTTNTATIVSGKSGQIVLSSKGIANAYQTKGMPYTILSSAPASSSSSINKQSILASAGPKVIVQTINDSISNERVSDNNNQRVTENTQISDFLSANTSISSQSASNFPKVIIQKSSTSTINTINSANVPKQIKFKLGPGSIVNSKIIKSLPGNLKIQRNVNTKGFTVLTNPSQIVQIQSAALTKPTITIGSPSIATPNMASAVVVEPQKPTILISNESTKTDWEQELDDVNRTKENISGSNNSSSCGAPTAKKLRIGDETNATTTLCTIDNVRENVTEGFETNPIELQGNYLFIFCFHINL
jgi:hypothetical protein